MTLQRIIEIFLQAVFAVRENRSRTIMSVVGIAVGIASVMIVGMVSQSGRDHIYAELESYGLNSLWVYRDWEEDNPFATVREGSGISNDDLEALRNSNCCPNVIAYSPVVYPEKWLVNLRAGNQFSNTSVIGVDTEYTHINNEKVIYGRQFRQKDIQRRNKVALIGSTAAKKLFGKNQNIVGKFVRMGEERFLIVGVLAEKKRDMLNAVGATQGSDENNQLLIPYTVYQKIMGTKDIQTLRALADNLENVETGLGQITTFLERRNSNKYKYKTESMLAWIATSNQIIGIISLIGGFAAFIALAVGGVGIFNIMSSSVIERTHEIGVLKAIGARNKDILLQFLFEASLVSVVGGLVGSVFGLLSIIIASIIFSIPVAVAWGFLFLGLIISILVGIFAGLYPARRAASLPPAVALRYN